MSKSDFNILIGVDLTDAEHDIKSMISSIAKDYHLKLSLIIENKDKVFEQIGQIQQLFQNIGKIDVDFGLGEGSREAKNMKGQLEKLANVDLSSAGEEMADSMRKAQKHIESVTDAYNELMRVKQRVDKDGTTYQTTTTGNKFASQSRLSIMDKDGGIIENDLTKEIKYDYNFTALNNYVDKAMEKIDSLTNVAKVSRDELDQLAQRFTQLHSMLESGDEGFVDEVNALNELIKHYSNLEIEMIKVNKVRETQEKKALEWANKIEEVQRKGNANPSNAKTLKDMVQDLTTSEFNNLDDLSKKLHEIQIAYMKLQESQKKNDFERMRNDKFESTRDKVLRKGKLDASIIGQDSINKLSAEVDKISRARTEITVGNKVKDVLNMYDKLLQDQLKIIELRKEEAQQLEDIAELQKHLIETENERARIEHDKKVWANEVEERTNKVLEKEKEINEQRSKMIESGLVSAEDFEEVENKLRELGKVAQNEFVENLNVDKELNDIDKSMQKVIERYNELDEKTREIRVSTHEWNKEIEQIRNTGLFDESEFEDVSNLMKNLSADSKTFRQDLRNVTNEIARMNAEASKRQSKKETIDINKGRNNAKLESMRGTVPDYLIDDVKALNELLDFRSSRTDIALIEDEMRNISVLNDEILRANKEQLKIQKAIENYQNRIARTIDKHKDALEEVVFQSQRQINDATVRNEIEQEAIQIQNQINALRERGKEITYDESRAIHEQIIALRQKVQLERDSISESDRIRVTTQRLWNRFHSDSYRATRGFRETSDHRRELQAMSDNIESMVRGLSGKTGTDFIESTREIEQALNNLNQKSRKFRDEDQKRRASFGGQLANAMRKVPIWTSAMEVFYGTLNQIRQGFRQILEIDKAMIGLQKVTESSKLELERFRSEASAIGKELGVVASEVIKATTSFQKLGYTLQQSAILGRNTLLYANVGDMTTETAGDNLVATIKGFGVEVDEQGHNIRRLVDMFNEVGNNFAVSAEGIGDALKRSSSVLNEAGNSIEESIGLVTAANAVMQDPKKVGTALKTISMRLRGVSEEGEDVSDLIPKLQSQFERINEKLELMGENALSLMKEDGETFKSTYEIMEMVVGVWDELSDIERANLVERMGGKHQGVAVSAIIQNWKDAEGAANTAANSAGSAMREFEAYMGGFEYKIGQLQNALERFWTTVIDDEAVKRFIDSLTVMIEKITKLVDEFGAGRLFTLLSGLFAYIASKGLRDAVKTTTKLGKSVDTLGSSFKGLGKWIGTAVGAVGRFIPYIGAIMLIGEGFRQIYKWRMRESEERKRQLKLLDDEVSKLKEVEERYANLFDGRRKNDLLERFGELQRLGESRSAREEEEFLEMVDRINSEFPELIAYYDEYSNAVTKSADEIKRLREENEKLILETEIKELELQIAEGDFRELNYALRMVESSYEIEDFLSTLKNFIEVEVGEIDKDNYLEVLSAFHEELNEVYEGLNDAQREMVTGAYNKLGWDISTLVRSGDLSKDNLLGLFDEYFSLLREVRNDFLDETVSEMDDFYKLFDQKFSIEIRKRGIEPNSNQYKFLEQMRLEMLANIVKFGGDAEKIILEDLPSYFDEAFALIDFDGFMRIDPETSKETIDAIDEMKKKLSEMAPRNPLYEIWIKQLNDLRRSHEEAWFAMQNRKIEPFSIERNVLPQVNEYINSVSDLNSAYRELNNSGKLSLDTILKLVTKYPELIKHMEVENGTLKITKDAIEDLAALKEKEFKIDMQRHKESRLQAKKTADEEIKNIKKRMEAHQSSINVKQLELGKKIVDEFEEDMSNRLQKQSLKEFISSLTAEDALDGLKYLAVKSQMYIDDIRMEQLLKELEEWEEVSKAIGEELETIDKLLETDWQSQLTDELGKSIQDGYYIVDEYTKTINKLNHAIEEQQRLQEQSASWSQKYQKALQEELRLTNEKKKAIDAEIESLKQQIKANSIRRTGLIMINENENDNKTARLLAAELQQEIDQAQSRLLELESESAQAAMRASEVSFMITQSRIEAYDIQREMLSDDIAYQEYAMGLYDETTEAYRKHAREKLNLLQLQMKYHKEELDLIEQERIANEGLTESQIAELNALIRGKRETIYDMANTIQDIKTVIAESNLNQYLDRVASEGKKYARAIEEIRDEIKYDLDEDKEINRHVQLLKEIIALRKGELNDAKNNIKYLKDQLELYHDNKVMVETITKEIEKWEDELKDVEREIKDVNLEIKNIFEKLSDEYVDLYREQLELMRDADQKYYENRIDSERKAHEQRIKNIEKESRALQRAFDKQMELIDREESRRRHTNELDKLQQEANELRRDIDLLAMDDSYEARSRRADLTKQLTEKEMRIAELKHNREIELRKQNLEDEFKSEQDKLDRRRESLDEQHQKLIENLEKEAEIKRKYWEDELENEKKFAELRQEVFDGNFESMLLTIEEWSMNVSNEMEILGNKVAENFTYKINEAVRAIKELNQSSGNMNIDYYQPTGSEVGMIENLKRGIQVEKMLELLGATVGEDGNYYKDGKQINTGQGRKNDIYRVDKVTNLDGDDKRTASLPKNNELNNIDKISRMKSNSDEWKNASEERRRFLEQENQRIGKEIGAVYNNGYWFTKDGRPLYDLLVGLKSGGYTGDWSGDEGRIALLHKKELVLNEKQTRHILDTARIVERIKSIIPTLETLRNIPRINRSEPVAESGVIEHNEYNIEVIVNGNADKKVADTVADQIVSKIKRTKGGRF